MMRSIGHIKQKRNTTAPSPAGLGLRPPCTQPKIDGLDSTAPAIGTASISPLLESSVIALPPELPASSDESQGQQDPSPPHASFPDSAPSGRQVARLHKHCLEKVLLASQKPTPEIPSEFTIKEQMVGPLIVPPAQGAHSWANPSPSSEKVRRRDPVPGD